MSKEWLYRRKNIQRKYEIVRLWLWVWLWGWSICRVSTEEFNCECFRTFISQPRLPSFLPNSDLCRVRTMNWVTPLSFRWHSRTQSCHLCATWELHASTATAWEWRIKKGRHLQSHHRQSFKSDKRTAVTKTHAVTWPYKEIGTE